MNSKNLKGRDTWVSHGYAEVRNLHNFPKSRAWGLELEASRDFADPFLSPETYYEHPYLHHHPRFHPGNWVEGQVGGHR